jgi:hypothetical protein
MPSIDSSNKMKRSKAKHKKKQSNKNIKILMITYCLSGLWLGSGSDSGLG